MAVRTVSTLFDKSIWMKNLIGAQTEVYFYHLLCVASAYKVVDNESFTIAEATLKAIYWHSRSREAFVAQSKFFITNKTQLGKHHPI